MAREDIRLEVIGDIEAYAKAVGKIPGVTAKEADKAAKAFVKSQKRAQIRSALEAEKAAKEASEDWTSAGLDAAKGFAAGFAGVGAVIGTVGAFVDQVATARLEMSELSRATGIGLDTLSGIKTAADIAGKEFDEVAGGLEDFGEKMFDASKGSGAAVEAFEILGFSQEDLKGRLDDTNGVLVEAIGKMQGMEEGALKNTVQQQLWGDAGNRLAGVLGEVPLDEFIQKADALGNEVTPANVAAAAKWKANLEALKGSIKGSGVELTELIDVSSRFEEFALGFVFVKNVVVASMKESLEKVGEFSGAMIAFLTGDFKLAADQAKAAFDFKEDFTTISTEVSEVTQKFVELRDSGKKVVEVIDEQTTAIGALSEEREKATKAVEEQARKDAALAKQQADAGEKLRNIQLSLTADTLSGEEAILRARDEQLRTIGEIQDGLSELMREGVDVSDQLEESLVAANEAVARSERDLEALREENHQKELDRIAKEADESERAAKRSEAQRRKEFEEDRALQNQRIDGILQVQAIALSAISTVAERRAEDIALELAESDAVISELRAQRSQMHADAMTERDALNAAILAATRSELEAEGLSAEEIQAALVARGLLEEELSLEELERQREVLDAELALEQTALNASLQAEKKKRRQTRKSALQAFKASKALAISDVAFQTAAAAMKAWALFGPPPSPPGIASAALAVAGGAVQSAIIATEKPPQFHDGFDGSFPRFTSGPDERGAILRQGEPVLNARAADNLGRDNIQSLNSTGGLGDGGGGRFGLFLDGRMIDDVMVRTLDRGGRLGERVRGMTQTRPTGQVSVFSTSR